jgi:hypothetical protein
VAYRLIGKPHKKVAQLRLVALCAHIARTNKNISRFGMIPELAMPAMRVGKGFYPFDAVFGMNGDEHGFMVLKMLILNADVAPKIINFYNIRKTPKALVVQQVHAETDVLICKFIVFGAYHNIPVQITEKTAASRLAGGKFQIKFRFIMKPVYYPQNPIIIIKFA